MHRCFAYFFLILSLDRSEDLQPDRPTAHEWRFRLSIFRVTMADPITILGTAGAVTDIIGVVGKTVKSLRDLHDRWRDADFTVLNLITQLTALKAALSKIQEWIDSDPAEQHHQLVMDLDMSMTCCRMLISKMDAQVSELHRTADEALDLGSRIKIVFGNKANEDLQKVIERQISALNLLLTACNL